jgi:carbonic anhydrase/acetyltransferase-like protein (isoleucine patch superfamily)
MAMLEGCVIGDGALIGMGAIVLQRASVGERSLVAAGAVVGEGMEIPGGVVAAGTPAAVEKQLGGNARRRVETAAREHQSMRVRYLNGARAVEPVAGGARRSP